MDFAGWLENAFKPDSRQGALAAQVYACVDLMAGSLIQTTLASAPSTSAFGSWATDLISAFLAWPTHMTCAVSFSSF